MAPGRIHAELRAEHGIRVGRKRVAAMKAAGISGLLPRSVGAPPSSCPASGSLPTWWSLSPRGTPPWPGACSPRRRRARRPRSTVRGSGRRSPGRSAASPSPHALGPRRRSGPASPYRSACCSANFRKRHTRPPHISASPTPHVRSRPSSPSFGPVNARHSTPPRGQGQDDARSRTSMLHLVLRIRTDAAFIAVT